MDTLPPSRLASGPVALPPKSGVVFALTLRFSAALLLAGALVACKSTASHGRGWLPPALAAGSFSDGEVMRARSLYVAKCAKCHRFYEPAAYSDPEWRFWMTKMSRKSRLTADEEALLGRYLGAFRLTGTAPQPAPR